MSARTLGRPSLVAATVVALSGFCALHWASLVESPPVSRVVAIVAVTAALACALVWLRGAGASRVRTLLLAAVMIFAAAVLGLLLAGIPGRLLPPGGWADLGDGIDHGLAGLGSATYPYSAGGHWPRLVLLAGLPATLVAATALACWPLGQGRRTRTAGLIGFLAMYSLAAVLYTPELPALHGAILLLLVAAWLWAPRFEARPGLVAGMVLGAGALALPLSAATARERPVIDYRSWSWTGGDPNVAFDWNHSYGPLDWPRDGTSLLEIESEAPHYWRTVVLERFDGTRWVRGEPDGTALEQPSRVEGFAAQVHPEWITTTRVVVRELRSGLVVAPGSVRTVAGLEGSIEADGTVLAGEVPSAGEDYEVTSYAPDPTDDQLRAASSSYPATLARFTRLELPPRRGRQSGTLVPLAAQPVAVPLRGTPRDGIARRIRGSGYGAVRRLGAELMRGAPTNYDGVKAVERHLQSGYSYSEEPAAGDHPLRSFLFEDRTGYCQQFSGAMALMLRLNGVPARVVSGFSPGAPDLDRDGLFIVRDTDAHSWVEVYFTGIGWVPFDPTPSTSPAELQSDPDAAAATPGRTPSNPGGRAREPEVVGGRAGAADEGGESAVGVVIFALLALSALAATAVTVRRRLRFTGAVLDRRLDAQVAELADAVAGLHYEARGGTTLLALEGRLRDGGRTATAAYVAALRSARFAHRHAPAPGLAERRSVRRELGRSRGARARLWLLLALPPGGPRPAPGGGG